MKLIAVIFACLLIIAHAEVDRPTLRVMTWNLQWFPGGRPGATAEDKDRQIVQVREVIRKINPDVVLLQEVESANALEETLKPLGPDWKVAIVSRFKQGNFLSGQQVAIAARMPAEAVWSESWEKGWAGAPRGYASATFKVNGKRITFYALHLKSNLGNPPENTSKREDAVEQLLAHIRTPDDRVPKVDMVVIGGDFNTDDPDTPFGQSPGERTFSMFRKDAFHWSFEGIAHDKRITCPGHGRYPDASFDHFFSKGLGEPLSAVVADVEGSDHRPVVMDIQVAK